MPRLYQGAYGGVFYRKSGRKIYLNDKQKMELAQRSSFGRVLSASEKKRLFGFGDRSVINILDDEINYIDSNNRVDIKSEILRKRRQSAVQELVKKGDAVWKKAKEYVTAFEEKNIDDKLLKNKIVNHLNKILIRLSKELSKTSATKISGDKSRKSLWEPSKKVDLAEEARMARAKGKKAYMEWIATQRQSNSLGVSSNFSQMHSSLVGIIGKDKGDGKSSLDKSVKGNMTALEGQTFLATQKKVDVYRKFLKSMPEGQVRLIMERDKLSPEEINEVMKSYKSTPIATEDQVDKISNSNVDKFKAFILVEIEKYITTNNLPDDCKSVLEDIKDIIINSELI